MISFLFFILLLLFYLRCLSYSNIILYSLFFCCKGTAVWKYPPNFLCNSENMPNFVAEIEIISVLWVFCAPKKNKTPNYG